MRCRKGRKRHIVRLSGCTGTGSDGQRVGQVDWDSDRDPRPNWKERSIEGIMDLAPARVFIAVVNREVPRLHVSDHQLRQSVISLALL